MRRSERCIDSFVELDGVEYDVAVHFDTSPAEAQTRDYPGCDASIEINSIIVADEHAKDIWDDVESAGYMETLEDRIIEILNSEGEDRE